MDKNVNMSALEGRLYGLASPDAPVGLAFLRDLLGRMGVSPDFRCIHVAGTNGKGSVCAILDSVLRCAGYKCALFTSPHLIRLTERLTIDGRELEEKEWNEALVAVEAALVAAPCIKLPYFSVLTAAAFYLIKKHSPDIVVLETGLGGTFDGTNVVERPLLSVITPIGLDHTALLGSTVEQIAESKFGIIKPGSRALFCGSPESLDARFMEVCQNLGASGEVFTYDCDTQDVVTGLEGTHFEYGSGGESRTLFVRLAGTYQAKNASLAVRALELISDVLPVDDGAVEKGLAGVVWPGRMEVVSRSPDVILDGAHNPHGTEALARALEDIYGSDTPVSFVFAAMGDKDYAGSLKLLADSFPFARLYCTAVEGSQRAEDARVLSARAESCGWHGRSEAYNSAESALEKAVENGSPVVICGSLYFVGMLKDKLLSKRQTKTYYNCEICDNINHEKTLTDYRGDSVVKTRVGVIGVGHMGRNHARVYNEIQDAELVGVVDSSPETAKEVGEACGVPYYTDIEEFLQECSPQAVSVAVPTPDHFAIASMLAQRGVHMLLEKPVTATVEQASMLMDAVKDKDIVVQVGHIERFNSALKYLMGEAKRPVYIRVSRQGPFTGRCSDVGVVLDLMIHDIDLVMAIAKSEVIAINAMGRSVKTEHEDFAVAQLGFRSGLIAEILASRVSERRMRRMEVSENGRYLALDFLSQEIVIHNAVSCQKAARTDSIQKIHLQKEEPLLLELESFIECVQTGKKPVVGLSEAKKALEVAFEVLWQIEN